MCKFHENFIIAGTITMKVFIDSRRGMKIFIDNSINVLWVCLNLLRWVGFLVPDELTGFKKKLYPIYFCFWFMFIVGFFIISQSVMLILKWGDVSEMTAVSFLMFTNFSFAIKIFNVVLKKKAIQAIIDEGEYELTSERSVEGQQIVKRMNKETTTYVCFYTVGIVISLIGWAVCAEKQKLPFRAWYPYDVSKFPAYQLTFMLQMVGVIGIAAMSVSLDLLVSTATAVCRCRFEVINLSLRNLCKEIDLTNKPLIADDEEKVKSRLHRCVLQHQAALESAAQIEKCFSGTILVQFTVSIIIICATAFQLAEVTSHNISWLNSIGVPLTLYFMTIIQEVYFYCNEAHRLTEQSFSVADAVYECPWYVCSVPLRRALLIVMARSRRPTVLTAGGFTTLSLACFMSIIRASYSFFTVLKQVEL